MQPLVSIITPSFNRADIIHETAESIFNQTYPRWEWIIVDDGSTDATWQLLDGYAAKDTRVKIAKRTREPKGACTCRNIGVDLASGDYVMFLDTDDLIATFCLEQRVKAMCQHPYCDFIIFPMLLFKKRPNDLSLLWNIDKNEDDVVRILYGDPICQGTGTLWKRNSFIKVGLWNEKLMLWQDIELHLRSMLLGTKYIKRLDLNPDTFIRVSDVSLSRTGFHSLPKLKSRIEVLLQTGNQVREKEVLHQYRKGLRYMFADIFISAANSNYFTEVKQLLKIEAEWNLFTENERRLFSKYKLIRKYKLYKFSFFQNYLQSRLTLMTPYLKNTVGKIIYNEEIKI